MNKSSHIPRETSLHVIVNSLYLVASGPLQRVSHIDLDCNASLDLVCLAHVLRKSLASFKAEDVETPTSARVLDAPHRLPNAKAVMSPSTTVEG